MTWTYTLVNPLSTKDQIRLHTGDTDTTDQLLQDEEIETLIATEGTGNGSTVNVYRVAALCCDEIASRYARQADKSISRGFFINASQQAIAYERRAKALRKLMYRGGLTPYAGGISASDKQSQEQDSDRTTPLFTRDMLTNPGTSTGALPNLGQDIAAQLTYP